LEKRFPHVEKLERQISKEGYGIGYNHGWLAAIQALENSNTTDKWKASHFLRVQTKQRGLKNETELYEVSDE
jgi:hypothetical protein